MLKHSGNGFDKGGSHSKKAAAITSNVHLRSNAALAREADHLDRLNGSGGYQPDIAMPRLVAEIDRCTQMVGRKRVRRLLVQAARALR